MECIKYIDRLTTQIQILKDLKKDINDSDLDNQIKRKEELLKKCKENLEKLQDNDICYRIYVKILNGKSVSRAINEVADENYCNNEKPYSTETIWKKYYPELKKILKIQ